MGGHSSALVLLFLGGLGIVAACLVGDSFRVELGHGVEIAKKR